MTTNRIDHTGHDHPATPAGRAACRKSGVVPTPALSDLVIMARPIGVMPITVPVAGEHCRQCGTADESNRYNDGYSSCCGMRIVFTCDPTDCFHQ